MPRTADPSRLPGLDLLRAFAIAWVMATHLNGFGLLAIDPFGWMGVDLFFVLSGFLIGGQLFRPIARGEAPDYANFFARRLLRTLPAYAVVLAAYAAFPAIWDRRNFQPIWQFATFTQNLFIDPAKANSFSQAWSLCVEEQFYLLLPAVMLLVGRRVRTESVVLLIAGLVLGGMGLRAWLWLSEVGSPAFSFSGLPEPHAYMRAIYYPTWTRLDGLTAGVGLALVKAFRPGLWSTMTRRADALLGLGLLGVAAAMALFHTQIPGIAGAVFGFPLLSVAMALLVAGAGESSSRLGRHPMPGAGALAAASYSIYLSHKIAYRAVLNLTGAMTPELKPVTPLLAVLAALALGFALYAMVERPFLNVRERLRRAAPAARPAPLVQPAE